MTLRKAIIIILFGTVPFQLFANNFSLNIGVNHSWLVYPNVDNGIFKNEFKPSISIGLNLSHNVIQDIEFTYGLRYFNVGRLDNLKNDIFEEAVNINHNYISFPIKIGYQLKNNIIPFVNIEPSIQIHSEMEYTNSLRLNEKYSITDEMNKFNLIAGLGIKYLFSFFQQNVGISTAFNFGILRISKDEKFDVKDNSSREWLDWRAREILVNFEYYFG